MEIFENPLNHYGVQFSRIKPVLWTWIPNHNFPLNVIHRTVATILQTLSFLRFWWLKLQFIWFIFIWFIAGADNTNTLIELWKKFQEPREMASSKYLHFYWQQKLANERAISFTAEKKNHLSVLYNRSRYFRSEK